MKAMTLAIELAPEALARLEKEAARENLDPSEYAKRLIERQLPVGPPDLETLALLARWDAEDATNDPDEIARRQQDWAEFQAAINESRTSDRKLFP
jgi:hypothetical protein